MNTDIKYKFGAPDLAMLATTFLWGLNAVIAKDAIGGYEGTFFPFVFNGLRIPMGALLLFFVARSTGGNTKLDRSHLPIILLISFFGMFMFMTTFIWGLDLTTASNAGVINATVPLLIILISFLSGIERPTKKVLLGIIVGFSGILALTYQEGSITMNTGDILILVACVCWAFYTVYGKRVLKFYSPLLVTAYVYLFVSMYHIPLLFFQLPQQNFRLVTPLNWFYLVFSAVGSIIIANTLYYYSINKIGPSRVGVYTNLTPVFTLVLAAWIRGEQITILQVTGLAVILLGIAISRAPLNSKKLV